MSKTFFEIGCTIIELENDVAFATGHRSKKSSTQRKSVYKEPNLFCEHLMSASADKFGFEQAGKIAGLWLGAVIAIATLPATALDGPLPVVDAAWAVSNFRLTRKLSEAGGNIGEYIDDRL
jgi:hypothetical protein